MSTAPNIERIPRPLELHIERDDLDSNYDEVKILGTDWQGQFTIATFNRAYAPRKIEATAQLMAAAEDIAAALQLAVTSLEREHVKNDGADAERIRQVLEQAKAAQAKAGL
ncbi:hypothetical protein PSP6_700005 [Paraburkholderia tropica]|uniref:hypothetical protein n=1 Tax=Paraburkholderia tropica TaxID=92647 RepID=UPI001CB03370|nr:hypothetical protein [Paraburkholderia tropica]CAG9236904.1 hypothetical protein PSP6_700005 [Paraburkholderia tropica]